MSLRGGWRSLSDLAGRVVTVQLGGSSVIGGRQGRGAGAFGAFGGPDERGDGLLARIWPVSGSPGTAREGVEVVPGDDVGDFLASRLAKAARRCAATARCRVLRSRRDSGVVGDLAQHLLGEPVAAPFRRQRVSRHRQHLPTDEL